MQFSESWLRSFCNPPMNTEALAHALTMAGLEVEDASPAAKPFSGIVIGEIVSREKHPNADRLSVCMVDVGSLAPAPLQIVCGAPNARVGIRIPVAMVGAALPQGEDGKPFLIKQAKMRSVESNGMLCSARELGISADADGLLELPQDAPLGANIREYLALDDIKFEIKLTPNKADCLSVYGVAREVHAITGAPLLPEPVGTVAVSLTEVLPVKISAPDLCGRFAGRVIRGVNAKAETPKWLRERLEKSGQRSISALVDISNYVMLELGRPSHVFDLDKVQGPIEVRWGVKGESLKLLNGNTVSLDEQVGVVADSHGVESLAGIMGGDKTAVSLETQNIYIEAAFWHPLAIQGRSRRFNFSTDAGHRFERGVDFANIPAHLDRISALVLEICGGQAGPLDDQIVNIPERKAVQMRVARAQKVIGVAIAAELMGSIFTKLGLTHTLIDGVFTVTPPSYRFDIEIEEDLIEEVARIYGFDNIPALPPVALAAMNNRSELSQSWHRIREQVADADYFEVINYSFVDEAWEQGLLGVKSPIRVLNPIASQMAVMRTSLLPGLLANIQYNQSHRADRVRVFELGKVFMRDASALDGPLSVAGIAQPLKLAGAAWGNAFPEQWASAKRAVDFFDVKADLMALLPTKANFVAAAHALLHPGRSAKIEIDGRAIGWLGELHPKHLTYFELSSAPILFELDAKVLAKLELPVMNTVSKMPVVRRDMALVVDDTVSGGALVAALRQAAPEFVSDIAVFDVYKGSGLPEGKKSLAIRVLMQDTARTLADTEIEQVCQKLLESASAQFGAMLRT